MPSLVEIGPPVPEKIFEGLLPYMDMAAILIMSPGLFTNTLVPPSYLKILLFIAIAAILVM